MGARPASAGAIVSKICIGWAAKRCPPNPGLLLNCGRRTGRFTQTIPEEDSMWVDLLDLETRRRLEVEPMLRMILSTEIFKLRMKNRRREREREYDLLIGGLF